MNIDLRLGDCLDCLSELPSNSVDAVIADLPYGVTQSPWDCPIPLDRLWKEYNRVGKDTCPFILFASQPFTANLITSNLENFKYCWYWVKEKGNGFLNAKKQPLRSVEEICVFYRKQCFYSPQMTKLEKPRKDYWSTTSSETIGSVNSQGQNPKAILKNESYPINVLHFSRDKKDRLHSTQKPLLLLEYLVNTYTKEGDLVLDNVMGSGTTGVACVKLNRRFIGMEIEKKYYDISRQRISEYFC